MKFIFFAYALGFIFQFLFWWNPDQQFWLLISMWTPALAILLAGKAAREQALQSAKKIGWRFFPLAFLIGLAPYIAAQLSLWLTNLGHFDVSLSLWRLPFVLLTNPIATGLVGALGEEIGWRGFLQPELQKRFKPTTAILIVGVVWAFWHIPANLAGHNGVENRLLNTFLIFPVAVVMMSFAFGWLRNRSDSIWPCVYLHGVVNSISNYWLIRPNTELLEKLSGTLFWLLIGLFFYCLIVRSSRNNSFIGISNSQQF